MGSMDWPWVEGKIEKIEAWITSLQSWGMFDRITVKRLDVTTGGTLVADHGGLLGLTDDDHTIYLLASGARNLTGNLTVSAGVTIDGVDISVHAATADAHHAGFIGLEDNAATAVVPAADDRIQLTDDGVINADASGSTIALSIAQGQIDHGAIGGLTDDDHGAVYPNFGNTETISGAWTFSNTIKADRADDAHILDIYEGATQKWSIYRDQYERIVFRDEVNEENKFHFGQSNNIFFLNMADNDVYCQLSGTPGDIVWGVYNDPSNHGFIGSLGDIPFAIRQNNAAVIWIDADAKVGIRIVPTHDFHVENTGSTTSIRVSDGSNNFLLQAGTSVGDGGSIGARILLDDNGTNGKRWDITTGRLAGGLVFHQNDDTIDAMKIDSAGKVGIGLTPTANMAGLSIEAGLLTLKETTTPTADATYGKIYTKTDNLLYFQSGDGVEHAIAYA